ncbi:YcjX family protein [Endozoicomonas elysicola]|uniref:YcjX family protein n=1 Tax=Endozoicomonas elysicola TaxID=305900 RepID=UPI00038063D8|nr:YcjX family protein [Endozoicomonas elysicola]
MKPIKHQVQQSLQRGQDKALDLARSTASSIEGSVDRLLNRRIALGVTGFSGSGKTTFITSLIHQLQHYPEALLAAFPPVLQDRLLGVQLSTLNGLPLFPYQEGIESLSRGRWPEATRHESGGLLEIKFRNQPGLLRRGKSSVSRLFLEIRDYPGEWLLDLPLLDMNYLAWCRQFNSLINSDLRLSIGRKLMEKLKAVDPMEPMSDLALQALWQELLVFLQDCQRSGLTMIQPGRWLHAVPSGAESQLPFLPLLLRTNLSEDQLKNAPENALFKVCERHYQRYKDKWVKPFYRNTFQKVDRQLVLIDVLKSLNGGQEAFDDLRLSLAQVLQSFDYGRNSLLRRLIQPRIDRVVFAASKIDQVLPDQHEAVRGLTANLVQDARRRAAFNAVDIRCEAVAAVRSTTYVDYQGRQALQGMTESGPGMLLHPAIPEQIPNSEDWQGLGQWQLRRLIPPEGLQLAAGGRLPHIRLDSILNDLLGDRFS